MLKHQYHLRCSAIHSTIVLLTFLVTITHSIHEKEIPQDPYQPSRTRMSSNSLVYAMDIDEQEFLKVDGSELEKRSIHDLVMIDGSGSTSETSLETTLTSTTATRSEGTTDSTTTTTTTTTSSGPEGTTDSTTTTTTTTTSSGSEVTTDSTTTTTSSGFEGTTDSTTTTTTTTTSSGFEGTTDSTTTTTTTTTTTATTTTTTTTTTSSAVLPPPFTASNFSNVIGFVLKIPRNGLNETIEKMSQSLNVSVGLVTFNIVELRLFLEELVTVEMNVTVNDSSAASVNGVLREVNLVAKILSIASVQVVGLCGYESFGRSDSFDPTLFEQRDFSLEDFGEESVTNCFLIDKCRLCWINTTQRGVCRPNNRSVECQCFAGPDGEKTYYTGDFCEKTAVLEPTSLTSNGAIVGIIVSSIIAVILVVVVSFFLGRAYLRRQQQHSKDGINSKYIQGNDDHNRPSITIDNGRAVINLTMPDDRYTTVQSDQEMDESLSAKRRPIQSEKDGSIEEDDQPTELNDPINDLNDFFNDQFMNTSENSLAQRDPASYRRKSIGFYDESFA